MRGGGGEGGGERETISSRSSRRPVSTVAKSCHGQPSAATGELLSAGEEGDGPPSLSPSFFSFSVEETGMSGGRVGVGSGRRSRAHPACARSSPRRGKIQSPG